VLRGELRNMFVTGWLGHPTLYYFAESVFLWVFGIGPLGARLLPAFIGVLTIPVFYLLARELFDRKLALIAAAILSAYAFHIHFSRIGLNNVLDLLLVSAAVYFAYRGEVPRGPALMP